MKFLVYLCILFTKNSLNMLLQNNFSEFDYLVVSRNSINCVKFSELLTDISVFSGNSQNNLHVLFFSFLAIQKPLIFYSVFLVIILI